MAWLRPAPVEIGPDDDGVPVEFHDPAHPLWHGRVGDYIAYMTERGWGLPARERMFVIVCHQRGEDPHLGTFVGSATDRRRHAVLGWAHDAGIMSPRWPRCVDHQRLKAMGLL